MITKIVTIRTEIGMTSQNAAVPAASRVNMIGSVAYATDDRLSLEKAASALTLGRRSSSSSSVASGRPKRIRRAPARTRSCDVVGALASGRAVMTPGATYRK